MILVSYTDIGHVWSIMACQPVSITMPLEVRCCSRVCWLYNILHSSMGFIAYCIDTKRNAQLCLELAITLMAGHMKAS